MKAKGFANLKAVILDSQSDTQCVLQNILADYFPNISLTAIVENIPDAVKAIRKYQLNLVVLDIATSASVGLQLFDFFDHISFDVVFVKAYGNTIQTFRVSSDDYLLKPSQLGPAQENVPEIAQNQVESNNLYTLDRFSEEPINRMAVPISDGLRFVAMQDIVYLEAEKAYTHIYLSDGNKLFVSKNLRELEKLLIQPYFFRTHRSYLINLNHVYRYIRKDGGYIIMDGGNTVNLAQNRRHSFLQACRLVN